MGCVSKLEEKKVYERLLKQYETSFNSPVPTRHKRGPLMVSPNQDKSVLTRVGMVSRFNHINSFKKL